MRPAIQRADARYAAPMLLAATALVAAGGWVHLREWLEVYRDVPATAAGAAVVRVGFPVSAAISAVVAVALLATALRGRRTRTVAAAAAAAALFQAGSLVALILSRTGSLLGWAEPVWTRGADQIRAVELGTLAVLGVVAAILALQRRRPTVAPVAAAV